MHTEDAGYLLNWRDSMQIGKIFIISIGLSMILCGCSKDSAEQSNEEIKVEAVHQNGTITPAPTNTPTPTPTPEATPDTNRVKDFRNSCWGDTKEEVISAENGEIAEQDDDNLLYLGDINGTNVCIIYTFEDDKLVRGSYALDQVYSNGGQYLDIFNRWKSSLTEKYGEPSPDSPGLVRYVDQDRIDMSGETLALELGYIGYLYLWETDTSAIYATINTEDYETSVMIFYEEINHFNADDDSDLNSF